MCVRNQVGQEGEEGQGREEGQEGQEVARRQGPQKDRIQDRVPQRRVGRHRQGKCGEANCVPLQASLHVIGGPIRLTASSTRFITVARHQTSQSMGRAVEEVEKEMVEGEGKEIQGQTHEKGEYIEPEGWLIRYTVACGHDR